MTDIRPIGIDQTSGQQKTVDSNDSVVGNIGNEITLCASSGGDFAAGLAITQILYPWSTGSAITAPSTVPTTSADSCAFSPNGEYLAVGQDSADPRIFIYQRTGTTFNYLLNQPNSQPTSSFTPDFSWSGDGQFLVASNSQGAGGGFSVYQRSGSDFTRLADPTTTPDSINVNAAAGGVDWSSNTQFLAVLLNVSPFMLVYERDDTTLNLLDGPASLPTSMFASSKCNWSPDGRFLAIANAISPGVMIYERSDTTLTLLAEPASNIANCISVAFSPDGKLLAAGGNTAGERLVIYQISDSTFTRLSGITQPTASVNTLDWRCDSQYLAAGGDTVRVFRRSGTNFTVVSSINNSANENGVSWSPDGQFLSMAHSGSPFLTIQQTGSDMPSSGLVVVSGIKRAGA